MKRARFELVRPPGSAVAAVLLTVLVLVGLTFELASFKKLRFKITNPVDTGSPTIVHRGQLFQVEGIADDGDSEYRSIHTADLFLIDIDPLLPGGEAQRALVFAPIGPVTKRFTGRLKVAENEKKPYLYVRVELYGRGHFFLGSKSHPLPGNLLKVRVE
jgi:hypothetical protein